MSWSKKRLVENCSRLRNHVRARGWAETEELSKAWPTDCDCVNGRAICKACARKPQYDWWMCHSQLMRYMGRGEWHSDLFGAEVEEEAMKALRSEPHTVTLLDGTTVDVHPKGLEALLYLRNIDWTVAFLTQSLEMLREEASQRVAEDGDQFAELVTQMDAIESEISYQQAVALSVATTKGPHFAKKKCEDPPRKWYEIDPLDATLVHRGFYRVNVLRWSRVPYIAGAPKKDGPNSGNGRMSWSVFAAQMSKQLKIPPKQVMREKSLAELLTAVQLAQPTLEDS